MELNQYLTLLGKRKLTILAIVLIFLMLAVIVTVIQPFKYSATSKILVITNFNIDTDPYSMSRSTEYLSNILSKVIYSHSFYAKVLEAGFVIDQKYFGATAKQQMKQWAKTIEAKAENDSGIITITAYHTDRLQAEQIVRAVAYTLQTKHSLYHGGGDKVSIKVIDDPITSNYPVKPNLILNFSLAIILGLIFSLFYIYLLPGEKYDLRLAPRRQKNNQGFQATTENWSFLGKTESDELDKWQMAGEILEKKVSPMVRPAESQSQTVDYLKPKQNLVNEPYQANNNGEYLYEEIVKQGNIKNIFGPQNSDNF